MRALSDIYLHVLWEFPLITDQTFSNPTQAHGTYHHIETRRRSVWCRPHHLTPDKLSVAKREFTHLHELGIIRPSSSEWASPLHMAPKANGEWGLCGD